MKILLACLTALGSIAVSAQSLKITEEKFAGRDAYVLTNGKMRVSMVAGGGFLGEIRLTTGDGKRDINPMRVPHYPTIDPDTYDDSKHNALYGSDAHRWLHSGYLGNYLCFPIYGPPSSAAEGRAGLGNHGEAALVRWTKRGEQSDSQSITLETEANLPLSQFRIRRRITMYKDSPTIKVEEWATNSRAYDRPFMWMQHATFGPPFIAPGKSILRLSAVKSGTEGAALTDRVMPAEPKTGSYTALLLDPKRDQQFFALSNADVPLSVVYVFPTAEHKWVGDWMENQRNTSIPWAGKTTARGIEFGSSPYAEGLKKAIERGTMFDTPTYRWIESHETIGTWYVIHLAETAGKAVTDASVDSSGKVVLKTK